MVHLRTAGMNATQFAGIKQLGAQDVKHRAPLWLKVGFWGCTVIAIAVALRRFVALVHPSQAGPAAMAALEQSFASRAALTFAPHYFRNRGCSGSAGSHFSRCKKWSLGTVTLPAGSCRWHDCLCHEHSRVWGMGGTFRGAVF
jgi:hypothetical protein